MRIVGFYHSLISDWNHGNAHFLRGLVSELLACGHDVSIYEPANGWSLQNLLQDAGSQALDEFHRVYPALQSHAYQLETLDLERELDGAQLVLVHEWNDAELVRRVGAHHRKHRDYVLLFHDTHHRLVTAPGEMRRYDLRHYDGVLAFGEVLRELYRRHGITDTAFTFHEAADTRVFSPREGDHEDDLVWIGNWGDDERTEELAEFLIEPARALNLRANIYGVRYPEHALEKLRRAGITYRGFVSNFHAPDVFAHHRLTVHVPRRPYVRALVGVPTIRVFEALACGIPLISAPWDDVEGLFRAEQDFVIAQDGRQMAEWMRTLLHEPERARALRASGLATIRARHTCAHRAEQLLEIAASLGARRAQPSVTSRVEGEVSG